MKVNINNKYFNACNLKYILKIIKILSSNISNIYVRDCILMV